jgi:hypothetical protein
LKYLLAKVGKLIVCDCFGAGIGVGVGVGAGIGLGVGVGVGVGATTGVETKSI